MPHVRQLWVAAPPLPLHPSMLRALLLAAAVLLRQPAAAAARHLSAAVYAPASDDAAVAAAYASRAAQANANDQAARRVPAAHLHDAAASRTRSRMGRVWQPDAGCFTRGFAET